MNCHNIQALMEQSIEARQPLPQQVLEHFEVCTDEVCLSTWEDYQLLNAAIPLWRNLQTSDLTPSAPRSVGVLPKRKFTAKFTVAGLILIAGISWVLAPASSVTWTSQPALTSSEHADELPSLSVQSAAPDFDGVSAAAPLLSMDWIGDAPLQVGQSMVSVLLGEQEAAPPPSPRPSWREIWPEQLLPIQEEVDAVRGLLETNPDQQTNQPAYRANLRTFI